ncbi:MAG: lysophospholipid acyltransferase family protein [Phycisphaerales bacterium]
MPDQLPKATIQQRYPGQSLASRCLYRFAQSLTYRLARLFYGFKPLHTDRVPDAGPLVVVCNHQSHFDPPLVSHCFRRRAVHFFARASLFDIPILGFLIPRLQAFPVKRGEADTKAIREALNRLELGAAVLLFPEGTRSKDGEVQEFKRGALLLLRKARCPVLPIAIDGAIDAFPRTRKFPKLFGPKLYAAVGEPIDHAELFQDGDDAALERLRTEVVRLKDEAKSR